MAESLWGVGLIAMGTAVLGFPTVPRATRWFLWALAATFGAGLLLWGLIPISEPLSASRRLAAILALGWALVSWMLRAWAGESDRLEASHPGVVVSQILCLTTGGYAIGMAAYFIIPQLALAVVQTWSYTILLRSQWLFTDAGGALDLFCVAASCIVLTRATSSAYLLVPLFWTLFLALLWQCLLIPPVIYEPHMLSAAWTGQPSLWALATLVCSAALVSSFVAVQGWSWQRSRSQAWPLNAAYLLRPPRSWPGLETSVLVCGVLAAFLGALLLVFPASAGSFRTTLPVLGAASATAAVGVSVLAVVHRHWASGMAELGCGLLTLSLCTLALLLVPAAPERLDERFPLIFNALIVGCAAAAGLWIWLCRAWRQQLLPDGRAWTTAGRMIPVVRRAAFLASALGIVFALRMGMWPLNGRSRDDGAGRIVCALAAMALLLLVVVRAFKVTGRPAYRSLILLSVFSMFVFATVRYWPE
jgi:hypothetical protein